MSHRQGIKNIYHLSHTFPNTLSSLTRTFLGFYLTLFKLIKFERCQNGVGISYLILKVLFVEHNDNRYFVECRISRQFVQFYHRFVQLAIFTCGIYHKNNAVNVVEVMLPQFRCLATDVPDCHHIISELNLFDVETNGGNCIRKLSVLTMKEKRSFASVLQTQQQNLLIYYLIAIFVLLLSISLGQLVHEAYITAHFVYVGF